ncbi:hypothetical protein ATANTOWER_028811 [Ataeniobius toweri]|uniref:Uncharacterized protein n=1 Tax=Ataeniobius toweri TaxID=208326 RepID=A0ABU7B388_9TELE|nr:hypothetical protein [Ataeniobius toweri]
MPGSTFFLSYHNNSDLAVCCQSEPPGVNQPESSWEEALVHLSLLFWYSWKEFPIQNGSRGRLHTNPKGRVFKGNTLLQIKLSPN